VATILELQQRHHAQAKELHDLVKVAEAEDRGLTDEERSTYEQGVKKCADLKAREKQQQELQDALRVSSGMDEMNEQELREQHGEDRKGFEIGDPNKPLTTSQRARGLTTWLRRGRKASEQDLRFASRMGLEMDNTECELRFDRGCAPSGEEFGPPRCLADVHEQARCRREREHRATNIVGTPALGGDLVPDEMMMPLERALLTFGGMRQVATIISTSTGASLPMPTSNDTTVSGEIIDEDAEVNEQAIAFGQVTLGAFKYSSKMIPVSVELMQDSATNMSALIGAVVGERIGRIQNLHFTTGAGTTLPRGILLDSVASGVTTASSAAVAYADLVTLKHSVDPAYRQGATWLMNDGMIALLTKLVDGDLRPLWVPSLVAGAPDMLLGHPIQINQSMPTGAGAKAIAFGQLSKYYIRDVLGITLLRLDERFAEFHRIAFLAFSRADGRLLDAGTNPVKHLLLGA
jgi:HK97 family phage major capsid protein